jgi:ligand-binding SRPBCC domain-containing protein
VAGVTHGLMGKDDLVTWRAVHFGIPLRLTAKIVAFDRPRSFEDVMTEGPFLSMRHRHEFRAEADGTVMSDIFDYEAPFGLIGRAFAYAVLTTYLRRFLRRRADALKAMAER